jgi:hypothetical protein
VAVGTVVLVAVGSVVAVIDGMGVGEPVDVTTAITVLPAVGVVWAAAVAMGVLATDVGAGPIFDRVQAAVLKRAIKRTPVIVMPSHLRIACLLCSIREPQGS